MLGQSPEVGRLHVTRLSLLQPLGAIAHEANAQVVVRPEADQQHGDFVSRQPRALKDKAVAKALGGVGTELHLHAVHVSVSLKRIHAALFQVIIHGESQVKAETQLVLSAHDNARVHARVRAQGLVNYE